MKKKSGYLICFIGIDGSGKTTLAKNVAGRLEKEGVNCQYVYGRVVPITSRFLMALGRKILLKRKKEDIFQDYDTYVGEKRKIFKNRFISNIYKWSILFDQIIQANLKVRLNLLAGKTVICDRYVQDTVITDIAVDLDYSDSDAVNLVNRIIHIISKPDITFLIDVPEEIAFARKNDVPHLSYLRERRKRYLSVGKLLGVITVDGTKSVHKVIEVVQRSICITVAKNQQIKSKGDYKE